jgi:hypothetical protein
MGLQAPVREVFPCGEGRGCYLGVHL